MEFLLEPDLTIPDGSPEPEVERQASSDELLQAPPLADWMHTTVTPLAPHPNDPAPKSPSHAVAWSAS